VILLTIAVSLVAILAALAAFIATRPAEFRIARSRTLAAPPGVAHAYVNDFHKWLEWSPWEGLDPTLKREFSGAPAGPGAIYHWAGNNKVGEGRMTILDAPVPHSVSIRLEFIRPWTATNTAQFDFASSGSGTAATWSMTGHNNFIAKALGLFMNMDKMVGSDFEKGLANLDRATATKPAP
jgi:hypothetical protein